MKKRIYLFLALVFSACFLFAQTEDKAQLEKERQDIQKEIKQIQGEYDKLKGKTKQIVGQYNLIDRKIKLQNKYISNISKELRMIDDDIYMSNRGDLSSFKITGHIKVSIFTKCSIRL
jgi:septal ring factor EnvC (AmiA/AmiB activator)